MQIRNFHQGFGAEVTGFDAQAGRAPEDIAALRCAFDERHLLVLRDRGRIAPERQVEIAGWFGPISTDRNEAGQPWMAMDNAEPAGSKPLPFHSDITYCEFPLEGISLHAVALPAGGTSTSFASNAVAWARLPAARQEALRGLKARHFYDQSHEMSYDWPVFEYWHPVCMTHPRTGQELLFVTEHHADRIEGMDEAEGRALLAELFAVLYAPERRYEHDWRLGDLVLWDNLAVQHARTRESAPSEGRRLLQRVAMGKHGFVEQLEWTRKAVAAAG